MIQDATNYVIECKRQLDDERYYKKLPSDTTNINNNKLSKEIGFLIRQGFIPKKSKQSLINQYPRNPQYYTLPNIHKANNPGRPIFSACDGPTEHISSYVDKLIKPLARELPSYIRDTSDFIRHF